MSASVSADVPAQRTTDSGDTDPEVGSLLDALTLSGGHVIHDRGVPGHDSNIDHIVIGAGGVFVVTAKYWSGRLTVGRDGLRHNGRTRQRHLRDAREQALVLQRLVEQLNPAAHIPIKALLCFAGDARLDQAYEVDEVELIDVDQLTANLMAGPTVLAPVDAAYLAAVFERGLPPRTGHSEAQSRSLPMEPPIDEVVFLTPWRKHGNDRLYVMDETGTQGGFLDLRTGEVTEELADAEPILRRLLPHLLTEDSGLELSNKSRDILGRFLSRRSKRPNSLDDESFVVGICAVIDDRRRLYVRRLDSFGHTIRLGWFDLHDRRVEDVSPDTEAIVRFCGESYLAGETN